MYAHGTIIYWMSNFCVADKKHIACSDYDGNKTHIYYNTTGNPSSLAIEDDTVYFVQSVEQSKSVR